jgi:hypothetical protein
MAKTKTESVSNKPKPKEKMKLWKKILIGLGVFIFLVIIISFSATSGIVKVAEKQLNLISSGDLTSAYGLTSQEFQESVSYDKFIAYINNYEVLKNYKNHKFSSKNIQGNTGTINGTITAKNGNVMPVEYKFVKENGNWKILSLNLNPSESTDISASGDIKTFSDQDLGYAIQYPKDWIVNKKDSATVLFSGPKKEDLLDVTLYIRNIASSKRGGTFADADGIVNDLKNQAKSMDKNATFSDVSEINFTRTDGTKLTAKSFAIKVANQGKKFVLMQVVVPHGDGLTFHRFEFMAPNEKFDKYLDTIKSILETWKINK